MNIKMTLATFRLEYEDDYEYEFKARALRKLSPCKRKVHAQYGKLVLVVVLVLQSEGRYCKQEKCLVSVYKLDSIVT